MKRTFLLIATAFWLAAGNANAAFIPDCAKDTEAIGHALAVLDLNKDLQAQVMALRDRSRAQFYAGDTAACEKTLAEAMRLLLFNLK